MSVQHWSRLRFTTSGNRVPFLPGTGSENLQVRHTLVQRNINVILSIDPSDLQSHNKEWLASVQTSISIYMY